MERKKKFFLITTIPISLNFFKGQISYLKNAFEMVLVSGEGEDLRRIANEEKVAFHKIRMKREISLFQDLISLISFIILFIKEKPNIIHCNTPKGSLLSLFAGFLTRIPVRIYYVHGLRYQGSTKNYKRLLMTMEKISCFCATDIIAVSYGVKAVLNKEITRKPVEIIGNGSPNGIDLIKFDHNLIDYLQIRESLQISQNAFVFGFIGRLVGDKGINELVSSFSNLSKKYRDIRLILIGRFEENLDPLKKSTMIEIEVNNDIHYLGFHADVRPFLSVMDVFIFPSYREGFGLSLMEANAMNVPAIATRITGCSEIIEEGINGFLIEPKNEKDLFGKMEYCINNKVVVKEMSAKSRKIIQDKFDQKSVWDNALEKYTSLSN